MNRLKKTRTEVEPGQVWTGFQVQVEGRTIRVDEVAGGMVIYTVLKKATYRTAGAGVGRMRIDSLRSAYKLTGAAA